MRGPGLRSPPSQGALRDSSRYRTPGAPSANGAGSGGALPANTKRTVSRGAGRLWRKANPALSRDAHQALVKQLMTARRAVRTARQAVDGPGEARAHAQVDLVKRVLGERGPVWWLDGAPDLNRHMARKTPYAEWFAIVGAGEEG